MNSTYTEANANHRTYSLEMLHEMMALMQVNSPIQEGVLGPPEQPKVVLGTWDGDRWLCRCGDKGYWSKDITECTACCTRAPLGDFEKFAFPIIRMEYPSLIASQIVGVQPMSAPASSIFYLDYMYAKKRWWVRLWHKCHWVTYRLEDCYRWSQWASYEFKKWCDTKWDWA